ncbi:hypothetical protein [Pararhizobium mangrovi]|uniref:Uncharacterized protein n=1 Tax=Pararhizobium mangrovi TaxID=2590452 RepID=A0A506UAQ2_9HYPH|nr:hypothetical protein [Pararhizobium mangrovi]TPW30446.1 hypothetical protein FJU11_05410 [Pararhizobium mangrovi]
MSLPVLGAVLGLVVALGEAIFLRVLSRRVDLPETKKALTVVGAVQLILFPIVGWFVADAIGGS